MAWQKIPKEHHPIFEAALPKDSRVSTLKMFGGVAAKVNGHMAAGLWADSMMVRLSQADVERAMKLDGTTPFDPMGRGKAMPEMVVLPSAMMKRPKDLTTWLERAISHTSTLPAKAEKRSAKAKKPAQVKKPVAKTKKKRA
jgi:TfoX/Sxy family transcriptional regulator of competence genes